VPHGPGSAEHEGIHRQHTVGDAAIDHLGRQRRRCTCGHQQGPEVFGGGMRALGVRRLCQCLAQPGTVALGDGLTHPGRELGGIGLGAAGAIAEFAQVARQAPRAHDEHAFFGQRRQRCAEGPGAVAVQPGGQRNLEGGHVGVRVEMAQRHPGAMVQAAPLVGLRCPTGGEHFQRALCQCGWPSTG